MAKQKQLLSFQEIAKITGEDLPTVRRMYNNAMRKLGELWADGDEILDSTWLHSDQENPPHVQD